MEIRIQLNNFLIFVILLLCGIGSICFNLSVFNKMSEPYLLPDNDNDFVLDNMNGDELPVNHAETNDKALTLKNDWSEAQPLVERRQMIHWNDTTKHRNPPTIYMCTGHRKDGMGESKLILSSALPEYIFDDLSLLNIGKGRPSRNFPPHYHDGNYTNSYDIFLSIFGMEQHCHPAIVKWILTRFNGEIAIFSGEDQKDHPITGKNRDHIHAFGPLPHARKGDMFLSYLQMTWYEIFQKILTPSALVDPTLRPRGKKTHYMIYANSNCVDFREKAVGELSKFGAVHCDGKCQGATPSSGNRTNLIRTKNGIGVGSWWKNIELYSNYRFCFVMEHASYHPTYLTEKIVMAFSAGCIPVYYGSPQIFDIFNEKAFVFYNITDPQPALDKVKALEEDHELYDLMLQEPLVAQGSLTIEKYFSFDDKIGNGVLKKQIREKLGVGDDFVP